MSALLGARIGIPRNAVLSRIAETLPPVLEAFEHAVKLMERAGAVIIENANFTAAADFVVNLQTYLDSLTYNPNKITSLTALRQFTQLSPAEEYPDRDTKIWDDALKGWNNTDPRFWPAYLDYLYFGEEGGLLGAVQRHSLDAVIMPSKIAASWAAMVGAPIVSVPLGSYPPDEPVVETSRGLIDSGPNIPFGLSFLGAKFTEEKLIGMAYAFEQLTNVRKQVQPYILPTVEIQDVMGDGPIIPGTSSY